MSRPLRLETFEGGAARERASPEALDARLEAARAEGREAGWRAARDEQAEAARDAAWALGDALRAATEDAATMRTELAAEAARGLAAALRTLCPVLAERDFPAAAARLIETRLSAAPRPLTVLAAPAMVERLAAVLEDGPAPVPTVRADPSLDGLTMRVAWAEGSGTFDIGGTLGSIMALAEEMAPTPPDPEPDEPDTAQDMEDAEDTAEADDEAFDMDAAMADIGALAETMETQGETPFAEDSGHDN